MPTPVPSPQYQCPVSPDVSPVPACTPGYTPGLELGGGEASPGLASFQLQVIYKIIIQLLLLVADSELTKEAQNLISDTDGRTDRWTDGRLDGQMDRQQTDRQTD